MIKPTPPRSTVPAFFGPLGHPTRIRDFVPGVTPDSDDDPGSSCNPTPGKPEPLRPLSPARSDDAMQPTPHDETNPIFGRRGGITRSFDRFQDATWQRDHSAGFRGRVA